MFHILCLSCANEYIGGNRKRKTEAGIEEVRSRFMYISAVILRCPVVDTVCHEHGWEGNEAREKTREQGRLE
jgi:hypothetical protein